MILHWSQWSATEQHATQFGVAFLVTYLLFRWALSS